VSFTCLTGHGSGHAADRATDDRPGRSGHRHADGRAAEDAGACSHGLVAVLVRGGGVVLEVVLGNDAPLVLGLIGRADDGLPAGCPLVRGKGRIIAVLRIIAVHVGLLVVSMPAVRRAMSGDID
jgi:hypothetical protein